MSIYFVGNFNRLLKFEADMIIGWRTNFTSDIEKSRKKAQDLDTKFKRFENADDLELRDPR